MSAPPAPIKMQIMPWALVYIHLMVRMPGGEKARNAVAQFVMREGLLIVETKG